MTLPAVVVHGGAGNPRAGAVGDEEAYHDALRKALAAAQAHPADALAAVEAAVRLLEDAPVFNAGRGSVLTSAGTVLCVTAQNLIEFCGRFHPLCRW